MFSIYPWFVWLAHTPISRSFNGASPWIFGTVLSVHLLGIVLVSGAAIVINLRGLQWILRETSLAEVIAALIPWLRVGAVMVLLTGTWLVVADPLKYFVNAAFRVKLVALLLAWLLQAEMRKRVQRMTAAESEGHKLSGQSLVLPKMVPATALLLWFSVALSGRVIGLL